MVSHGLLLPDLDHQVRSSWEANYCRILKHLGIKYEYEPDTFTLPSGRKYTPDIKLRSNLYVEIKGFATPYTIAIIKEFRSTYPRISLIVVDSVRYNTLTSFYLQALTAEMQKRIDISRSITPDSECILKFVGMISTQGKSKVSIVVPQWFHEQALQLKGKQVKVIVELAIKRDE